MALVERLSGPNLALAGAGLCIVFVLAQWLPSRRTMATIPSPDGNPLLWGRSGMPADAIHVFRDWAQQYGELFRLRIGWYDWVVVNSPAAFKEIFDKQSIHTSSKIPAPIGHGVVTGGLRMFTMGYGAKWRTHRSIMHRLLAPKAALELVPSQEFEVKQLLHELAADNGDETGWYQHVRRLSFSIISTSTYGRRIETVDHADVRAAAENTALLGRITRPGVFLEDDLPLLAKLPPWLQPSRRRARQYAAITIKGKARAWKQLKAEVEAGVAAPSFGRDLVETDYREGVVDDEACAWILGGLADAGTEITAVVMQNLILYLAATPAAQQAAYAEVARVVGDGRPPAFADLPRLPYIRACVKETLRIAPVPPWAIKHFTDADIVYRHHRIPAGTVVLANTSAMHYDPARFPDPAAFRPERYLDHPKASADYAAARDPDARDHFTFGGGRRVCPGARLAENTVDIVAANLVWAFDILPPLAAGRQGGAPGRIETGDAAFEPSAFRAPKPFRARFVPRPGDKAALIARLWQAARVDGYLLRGVRVSAQGIER